MLQRIRGSLIAATAPARQSAQIGPFIAMLSAHDDLPWINYAVPNEPLPDRFSLELQELEAHFKAAGRLPRFEFFSELAPSLEEELIRRGYRLQGKLPAMVCDASSFQPFTAVETRLVGPGDDLVELARVTMRSFGHAEEPKDAEIENARSGMLAGRTRGAIAVIEGVPAGGAYAVGDQDVRELAGVGTLPEYRRRGVASAVSSTLMAEHFKTPDALVWLSAGDEVARAVYEKLGFRRVTTQLNYIQDH